MLNPGPGFRRIRCPACQRGEIRRASGSAQLQCDRLRWSHSGFSGGACDFTTHDETDLRLSAGEQLVIVDFTPFARTDAKEGQP